MKRTARLKVDPQATDRFLMDHTELIEENLRYIKTGDPSLVKKRFELASLAREQFGYAERTSSSDIISRLMRVYRRTRTGELQHETRH